MTAKSVPKETFGKFYSGDAYIVLQVRFYEYSRLLIESLGCFGKEFNLSHSFLDWERFFPGTLLISCMLEMLMRNRINMEQLHIKPSS